MKLPFFNLKASTSNKVIPGARAFDTLQRLMALSDSNDKQIDTIYLSDTALKELQLYYYKGQMFGYKVKRVPDIAVVWKKKLIK